MRHRFALRRPSPALVVSCIALFMSLGGVSYGLATGSIDTREIRNGTIRSADVRNEELTGRDIRDRRLGSSDIARDSLSGEHVNESRLGVVPFASAADGVTRHAVVTSAGALARGRNVSSATRTAEGRYQVIFTRDVRNCAYFATVADVGAAPPASAWITASALASNVNGVAIRTTTRPGNQNQNVFTDRPFHLIVLC